MKKTNTKTFVQYKTNGFAITFPNGNWLSTIWGSGSYTENHYKEPLEAINLGSDTVEIMPDCPEKTMKKVRKLLKEEEDGSVFGHLTFEKWLKVVNLLAE